MATFNLVRNSRVFFTTNVAAGTGIINATGLTVANTQELQVLDGFTFSQATNADTIQISEAGTTPVRGQRSFNTSLNNVEFSMSTYIRPYKAVASTVTAEESVLWNALLSATAADTTAATITGATAATYATTTGILTIAGSAMTYAGVTSADYGKVFVMAGIGGANAKDANVPVKLTLLSATSITVQILSPIATAMTLTAGAGVKFMNSAWTSNTTASGASAYGQVTTALSNKNQLQAFGMIFVVDGISYAVDNCAMDSASIDFSLDGIATIAWAGKGTALRQVSLTLSAATDPVFTGDIAGTANGKEVLAKYITNKLSTVALTSQIGGGGTAYTLALTGGNITIANNITYVVPANLGVINSAIGYFTGTRAVSGNLTAYLRTGATNTAGLLSNLLSLTGAAAVEPKFQLQIDIGGSSNDTRVEALIYGAMLQIPTVDAQAVMSTTINFTAQGTDYATQGATAAYDIENTNELLLRYYSVLG
jgi:hypothetical protein